MVVEFNRIVTLGMPNRYVRKEENGEMTSRIGVYHVKLVPRQRMQ